MGFNRENLLEGHRKRLRERFYRSDLRSFQDYEALELLLTYAIPRIDVKPIAKELLLQFGSVRGVLDAQPYELFSIKNLGPSSVGLIRLFKELSALYLEEKMRMEDRLDSSDKVSDFLRMKMSGSKKEFVISIYLDIHDHLITFKADPGTVDRANVYLREIVSRCLLCNASKLIIAHNHPSGMIQPSANDILFTRELNSVLGKLDIELRDHLIIADNMCHSIMPDVNYYQD